MDCQNSENESETARKTCFPHHFRQIKTASKNCIFRHRPLAIRREKSPFMFKKRFFRDALE